MASRDGPCQARGEHGPRLGWRAWLRPEQFVGLPGGWPLVFYSSFRSRYRELELGGAASLACALGGLIPCPSRTHSAVGAGSRRN
ncbi:hypothetical protein NDU88_004033 [Pleurodeles waltl]|uniref:Uncharacterized protein n=1 Tax=Pleurodeles waltl TaxID=8319 RepID=A0AAV7PIL1_PLEWA|nr:hypothetical protein NDU88_004033 [Pleurodeles waltl]